MLELGMSEAPADVGHMSDEQFQSLIGRVVAFAQDYWSRLEELPVRSTVKPGEVMAKMPARAPMKGADPQEWNRVFEDLESIVVPGLTNWQSPNFFAFFPANISEPAIVGELLSACMGVQGMMWATSPACTEVEVRVLDWLVEMLGLPESFLSTSPNGGGVIQATASESTLAALLAARRRARRSGVDASKMTLYTSNQAHSSIMKAAMVAGFADGADDFSRVRMVDVNHDFSMRTESLAARMREDRDAGFVPIFVCGTIGTTGTTAVDPIEAIARVIDEQVKDGHRPWLHVDAAHSGAALVCPEFRWMSRGVDRADSFCFNPHKWLLTNFDCDCFWTSDRGSLIESMSITPEYLRNAASDAGTVTDYRDWHVPLGRRFRSLKLWLVIRHYGVEGLRAFVRSHISMAQVFESLVRRDDRFEIVAPRTVNLVCFRLRPLEGEPAAQTDARNRRLLERVNATGKMYMIHTVVPRVENRPPTFTLRMAIGAVRTKEEHVRAAWETIRAAVDDGANVV